MDDLAFQGEYSDHEFDAIRRRGEEIRREFNDLGSDEDVVQDVDKDAYIDGDMDGDLYVDLDGDLDGDKDAGMDGEEEEEDIDEEWLCDEGSSDEEGNWAYNEPRAPKPQVVTKQFNPTTPGRDINFKLGLAFANKKEVKTAVREFSVAQGRPLRYAVDDLHRIQVRFVEGCPFKLWVSYVKAEGVWIIKTIVTDHNCLYEYRNKLVSVRYLANLYGERIRKNPNWKMADMHEEIRRELKVGVADAMARRVRKMALSGLKDALAKHYEGVRRFGGEILRSNKENTVKISTTRENLTDPNHFQRFYVCYAELKKAWKDGCRPVLGLDGCFLKTVCRGGQLLSAVGRDGNNAIFPVAMAVVEGESYASWSWFLKLLVDDLALGDGYGYTFISDQQKGLDKAVKELLPYIEHRNCTRHLYANLQSRFPSEDVKFAFYEACNATFPEAFKAAMKKMEKASKEAHEKMSALNPKVWSKAFFETHSKTDSTENNMSECFNSWILRARYMPLIDMLTEIHDLVMERMHQKRDAMANVNTLLIPRVRRHLEQVIKSSYECRCLWDGRLNYEVKWRGIGFCVNLQEHTCSCRVWQLTGIPCIHGVTAILSCRLNPIDFVSKYYTKATYMKCYNHCLEVLKGEPFWEEVVGDTILPPPISKVLRGRPKRQRRKEGWERQTSTSQPVHKMSRVGRVMHCGNCGNAGHNSRKCPQQPRAQPMKQRKRGRRTNNVEGAQEVQHAEEVQTWEAQLMEEVLRENTATQASQACSTIED